MSECYLLSLVTTHENAMINWTKKGDMQRSELMSVSESVTQIPAVTAVRDCLQVKHRSHNPSSLDVMAEQRTGIRQRHNLPSRARGNQQGLRHGIPAGVY